MKPLTKVSTTTLLLLLSSFSAANQAMIEMSISMMKKQGALAQLSQCTGVSKTKLESALRKSMGVCLDNHPIDDEDAMASCMQKHLTKNSGVGLAKFESCEPEQDKSERQLSSIDEQINQLEQQQQALNSKDDLSSSDQAKLEKIEARLDSLYEKSDAISNKVTRKNMTPSEIAIEDLYAKIGNNEPTQRQQARLEKLMASAQKDRLQEMGDFVELVSEANQGTESKITLPLYTNSTIMAHITNPSEISFGDKRLKTLAAATFSSNDEIQKIIVFYKKELPDYQFRMDEDTAIFMKKMAPNFSILTHLEDYTSTPHIAISAAKNNNQVLPKGTRSVIEIAYKN
jgi:hypothetical protein